MKAFERSEEYLAKIMVDALDRDVRFDAQIQFVYFNGKLKAYCPEVDSFLQFPNDLRTPGIRLIADIVKAQSRGRTFYRAYKGSIRNKAGDIIG